jgi:diguanylate cyclase (GGDEF)-like protein
MRDNTTETMVAPLPRLSGENARAYLVHIYPVGSMIGTRNTIEDQPLTIGRGTDCDITIPDSSVSRVHARIEKTPQGVFVYDLGSTNGTYINDKPVHESGSLKDGDYLRVGNCILRYLAGGNVEAAYHEEIYRLTIIDALTQAHNRRALLEFLDRELVRSQRHHRPISLLLMDIDYFKKINDSYGHTAGDFALRELARIVRLTVRREDMFARYGGEELALVLVETGLDGAKEVAERVRREVEDHVFRAEESEFRMTLSIGVASTPGGESLTTTEMIRRADEKLYEAKRTGRNRVVA